MVGDHESIHRIYVVQACDLVLGIGFSDHHRESDVIKGYAGLRIERLRRGDRGIPHIARIVYHHAVAGSGGTVVKGHEVDNVVAGQPQALDLIHHRRAGTSSRNGISRHGAERLNGKAELQFGESLHRRLSRVDQIVNERLRLAQFDIVINADKVWQVITIDKVDQPLTAGAIERAIGSTSADDVLLARIDECLNIRPLS